MICIIYKNVNFLFVVSDLRSTATENSTPEHSSILRHRSRDSESSERINGSLQRQKSSDSNRSLRQRSVSVEDGKKDAVVGEKLIEIEKTETGSVKWTVYKHYLKSIGVLLTCATILLNMIFQGKMVLWMKSIHCFCVKVLVLVQTFG